jgi:hypothetical protein
VPRGGGVQVFRIGHLGNMDELMLSSALAGVEMAMIDAGIKITPGGGGGGSWVGAAQFVGGQVSGMRQSRQGAGAAVKRRGGAGAGGARSRRPGPCCSGLDRWPQAWRGNGGAGCLADASGACAAAAARAAGVGIGKAIAHWQKTSRVIPTREVLLK